MYRCLRFFTVLRSCWSSFIIKIEELKTKKAKMRDTKAVRFLSQVNGHQDIEEIGAAFYQAGPVLLP